MRENGKKLRLGRVRPPRFLISLVLAITSPILGAQDGLSAKSQLRVEPELIRTMYCSNKPGVLTLDAKVRFTYNNVGQTTVILPRFFQLKRYRIFSSADAVRENRPFDDVRFSTTQLFDLSKLDLTKPDQTLFDLVEPGGSRAYILQVIVVLRHPNRTRETLLGKESYLGAEINHWFGSHQLGEELERRWRKFGELWIENVVAPPLRLLLESNPVVQSCHGSVD